MKIAKIAALASAGLFALLAVLTTTGAAGNWNLAVADAISGIRLPWLTDWMGVVTYCGEWFVYVPLAALLLLLPRTRLRYGLPVAAVLAVSAGLNELVKLIFAIERPLGEAFIAVSGYGFPSGHAQNGAAFAGICACLVAFYHPALKKRVFAAAAGFILLIGFSRIYLNVHSFTDIAAGFSAGLCLCALGLLFCLRFHPAMKKKNNDDGDN